MSILTNESLEFARGHIQRYYDSDFFPKPFEFNAIWHSWVDVKKFLSASNVYKLPVAPAKSGTWHKPKGGFRIVHQLEPLDALVYTALVYQISEAVEKARHEVDAHVACAYRIALDDSSFFAHGSGYENFRNKSLDLASKFKHVLLVDVADFYNQIYLHRVNNAIEHSDGSLKALADDVESFLMALNSKISQGLPVGPAASIVLAEAVMIDVDQHLSSLGCPHCRYVDDFRIFSDSQDKLTCVLEALTLYLYQNHRLSIAGDKTRLLSSSQFVVNDLNNPYELEKIEVFAQLQAVGDYGSPENEDGTSQVITAEEYAAAQETIVEALKAMIDRNSLDLGFSRALIRQARMLRGVPVAKLILNNIALFAPVANNLVFLLNTVTDQDTADEITPYLESAVGYVRQQGGLLRKWFEWFVCENYKHLNSRSLRQLLADSPFLISQARGAVLANDLAWVRQKKNQYYQLGPEDRRAILYAVSILPDDERKHWLKGAIGSAFSPLEGWVAKYVLEGMGAFDDDLLF